MKEYYPLGGMQAHGILIRQARLDGRLRSLVAKLFPHAEPGRGTGGFFFVAEKDGEPVGFAEGKLRGKTAWLCGIGVRKEFEGIGLGGELVESLVKHASKKGCMAVRLKVSPENSRAVSFYERHGFSWKAEKKIGADQVYELSRGIDS